MSYMNLNTALMSHLMNPEMHLPISFIHITPILGDDPCIALLRLLFHRC